MTMAICKFTVVFMPLLTPLNIKSSDILAGKHFTFLKIGPRPILVVPQYPILTLVKTPEKWFSSKTNFSNFS